MLPWSQLADTIGEMLLAFRNGKVRVPDRLHVDLANDGQLLVMPASDDEIAITKLVSVHPDNGNRGLPTIQGEVVVLDARDGRRLGILDGPAVTGRRTAALSLLAVRKLAPVPGGKLLILGAGVQARSHLEAFHEGLDIGEVVISSRTEARAKELAAHAGSLGLSARVAADAAREAQDANLIVTATTSNEPLLAAPLHEGQMVCAVGAFRPHMAELAPELVAACQVFVDDLAGVRAQGGDLIRAVDSGLWSWKQATPLVQALDPENPEPAGPVLFKSVGHALFDLAAARLAFLP